MSVIDDDYPCVNTYFDADISAYPNALRDQLLSFLYYTSPTGSVAQYDDNDNFTGWSTPSMQLSVTFTTAEKEQLDNAEFSQLPNIFNGMVGSAQTTRNAFLHGLATAPSWNSAKSVNDVYNIYLYGLTTMWNNMHSWNARHIGFITNKIAFTPADPLFPRVGLGYRDPCFVAQQSVDSLIHTGPFPVLGIYPIWDGSQFTFEQYPFTALDNIRTSAPNIQPGADLMVPLSYKRVPFGITLLTDNKVRQHTPNTSDDRNSVTIGWGSGLGFFVAPGVGQGNLDLFLQAQSDVTPNKTKIDLSGLDHFTSTNLKTFNGPYLPEGASLQTRDVVQTWQFTISHNGAIITDAPNDVVNNHLGEWNFISEQYRVNKPYRVRGYIKYTHSYEVIKWDPLKY